MAKYYGSVYYAEMVKTGIGVWEELLVERKYYGDVLRNTRRLESDSVINDGINVGNQISIVADPYALQNFSNIRCIDWMGQKWKVTTVEVTYPRLLLSIGGLYNENS